MKSIGRLINPAVAFLGLALFLGGGARAQDEAGKPAAPGNVIQSVDVSAEGGAITIKVGLKDPLAAPPAAFTVNNPPRIALDFPNTANGLGKNSQDVNQGDLRNIRLGQSGGRTRVVLNLSKMSKYESRTEGNVVIVTLHGAGAAAAQSDAATTQFSEAKPATEPHAIRDVDFRRGKGGEAQIIVDLSDTSTGIDLKQQGRSIIVDFLQTALPPALERRYDVTDFGTQVESFEVMKQGSNTRITLVPKGRWEQSAYQTDKRFIIEVKPVVEDPSAKQKLGKGYTGDKLSLNFQNIEVRAVLQVIADFTNLNIITSDTVSGNLTLRLKDVPWDQALDIILQAKGLDMRKTGNVVWIAPRDELATKEKLALEAQAQIADLEPMRTETFQLNYQKADAFQKILTDSSQKILSKRGSAVWDPRTNIIFVQDIASKLDEVRELIKTIDIPTRQVLIEARIVEASDTFSRNLGARLGYVETNPHNVGDAQMLVGGGLSSTGAITGLIEDQPDFFTDGLNSNMPAPGLGGILPGQFSMILMNESLSKFLNLEITALQADGKGKIISSPRVVTADNVEAIIEQGTEIPYQQATSSGATSVSFRKATLSLKVKPQITPNDNIIMKLNVNKDSVGANTSAGPAIDTKQVSTEVLVENGGTVGLGGIYTQDEASTVTKVPMLGDIPVLGIFFRQDLKRNDKRELLIFVTPKVVKETPGMR
jgi:type IV pilus assembly protein PilQ